MSKVEIEADDLDILLWFAKIGDVANAQRHWRSRYRKRPVCSDPANRQDGCASCRAFTAAEQGLKSHAE